MNSLSAVLNILPAVAEVKGINLGNFYYVKRNSKKKLVNYKFND